MRIDAPHDEAHHTLKIDSIEKQEYDPDPQTTFMFQVVKGLCGAIESAEKKFRNNSSGISSISEGKGLLNEDEKKEESAFFNISSPYKGHGLVSMKDYFPFLFCRMRTHQGVSSSEYEKSWSYTFERMPKAEVGAGRSNSLFLKSQDERFILKTLPHHEVVTLRDILPAYFAHLERNPESRLLRFVGLHRFRRANQYLYVVVMSNIFYSPVNLHIDEKYDLKGRKIKPSSERKIKLMRAGVLPKNTIIKDNQLERVFFPQDCEMLRKTLISDADFLNSQNCIDYSLLVGVHVRGSNSSSEEEDYKQHQQQQQQFGGRRGSVSLLKEGIPSEIRKETYFIGIIDFLSRFETKKKIANCCKRFLWESATLSTVPPLYYRDRWVKYLDAVLMGSAPKNVEKLINQEIAASSSSSSSDGSSSGSNRMLLEEIKKRDPSMTLTPAPGFIPNNTTTIHLPVSQREEAEEEKEGLLEERYSLDEPINITTALTPIATTHITTLHLPSENGGGIGEGRSSLSSPPLHREVGLSKHNSNEEENALLSLQKDDGAFEDVLLLKPTQQVNVIPLVGRERTESEEEIEV